MKPGVVKPRARTQRTARVCQKSLTELAIGEFIKRIKSIGGVNVKCYGGASLADQTIVVEVPSITGPEARSVVRLQGEIYAKYPGARVPVDVSELRADALLTDNTILTEN